MNAKLIELFKRGINLEESLFMPSFTKSLLNYKSILFLNSEDRTLVGIVNCHDLSYPQGSSNIGRRVRRRRGGGEGEGKRRRRRRTKTVAIVTKQQQLSNAGGGVELRFWARLALNPQNIYTIPQYSATVSHCNLWR
jgi:hypothetical protein